MSSQLLTVQDEECSHTKWLTAHNLKEDNYIAARWETGGLIEPNQVKALGPAYNNYIGTEWTMVNGLKVIVRQGDLVDAEADVIVNPANSKLCHGGGASRAISVAARKELDDECNEYVKQFRSIKVGRAMHTTAGNLQPQIKHMMHAVRPKAHEKSNRQDNFDLVQRTVVSILKHSEHVLNATSIALPAISAGIFGVPKIDVAQALYQAILKFDETKPGFVKTVQLVNIDRCVTDLMNKEFAWWFGGMPECVSTKCRTTILQNFIGQVRLLMRMIFWKRLEEMILYWCGASERRRSTFLKSLHTFGSVIHLLVNTLNVNLSLMVDWITAWKNG